MVAAELAWIDDQPAEPPDRVFTGQRVRIRLVEPPDKLLDHCDAPVRIVYEDPWLIVVDKPAGLVAHPVGDFQDGTLSNVLQKHLDQQTAFRGMLRPGVVHRLDRMTSGLLVTAKEHLSHRLLSIDFQQGKLSKSYVALVAGTPDFESRMIELPIRTATRWQLRADVSTGRRPQPTPRKDSSHRAAATPGILAGRMRPLHWSQSPDSSPSGTAGTPGVGRRILRALRLDSQSPAFRWR
jgi:23S rRNA-/tRNA-specific pseudouridylate synthase